MVASGAGVVIDATFIFEDAARSFVNTPLLFGSGKDQTCDQTFVFGALRDLLRLRAAMHMNAGTFVAGKETWAATDNRNSRDLILLVERLGFPVVSDPSQGVLDVVSTVGPTASYIATRDKRMLQLCTNDLTVILVNQSRELRFMGPERVISEIGVQPEQVPAYLALTDGSMASALTTRQAMRLLEVFGDWDNIYEFLAQIKSRHVKEKLVTNRDEFLASYSRMMAPTPRPHPQQSPSMFRLDTPENVELLKSCGFHSLVRLLSATHGRRTNHYKVRVVRAESERYHAVLDRKGLDQLSRLVASSSLCAIDTESDSTDPRQAELFGVSLCCDKGSAYFVPFFDADLRGITKSEALAAVKSILEQGTRLVGHNIKYDYVLLRRNGIKLKSIHFDTMLASYVCFGDWPFFNLSFVADKLLTKKVKSCKEVVGIGKTVLELPLSEIVNHGCQDADITCQLYETLCAELAGRTMLEQNRIETLPLVTTLGDRECDGVAVDTARLESIRACLLASAIGLKAESHQTTGAVFDPDSNQELSAILRDRSDLAEYIGQKTITPSLLADLAIVRPVIRPIAWYMKVRAQLRHIDSIARCVRGDKVYPVFNPIRSPFGLLSSNDPNLFDIEGISDVRTCFDNGIRGFFRDPDESLRVLSDVSGDDGLRRAITNGSVGSHIIDDHGIMEVVLPADLLLSIAVGKSDTELCRRYLIDSLTVSTMRTELCTRYPVVFAWLKAFREKAAGRGVAAVSRRRKYLHGLTSSNVFNRTKAMNHAVRWAIKY